MGDRTEIVLGGDKRGLGVHPAGRFTSIELLRGIAAAWICYLFLHIPATILILGLSWWPEDPSSVREWAIAPGSLIVAAPASATIALLGFFPAVLVGRMLMRVRARFLHLLAYAVLGFLLGAAASTLAYLIVFLPAVAVYGITIWPQLVFGYGAAGAVAAACGATITMLWRRPA